ncbi:MAG: hypothetical protein SGPRY_014835, partial [Prymnesium sp.]
MGVSLLPALGVAAEPVMLCVAYHESSAATAVLFCGDLTRERASMLSHPSLAPFARFCAERLTSKLASRLPGWSTVLVLPPRSVDGFSCYDCGFLDAVNITGDPLNGAYSTDGSCCSHVLSLLRYASETYAGLASKPVHLLGFSKGGVVLNQILAEWGAEEIQPDPAQLLLSAASLSFLDPGLNGEGPIFLDDRPVLRRVAHRLRARLPSPPRLLVSLTPYTMGSMKACPRVASLFREFLPRSWKVRAAFFELSVT